MTTDTSTNDRLQTEHAALRENVSKIMHRYFTNLDGAEPHELYDLVLEEVEAPLFESVMEFTKQNQSKAARLMGISRGTLRTKLKKYGLLAGGPDDEGDE